MKGRHKKTLKRFAVISGFVGALLATRLYWLEEQGNFYAITPNEAYRSAQMDRDELDYYILTYGIQSVINLRGEHPSEPWYMEETESCRRLNVRHYDLALSADSTPSLDTTEKLLTLFRSAPRPVLIHCRAGADRSGLAAALWKVVIDGAPAETAKGQLSIRFGHLPLGPTQVLDFFFDQWASERKVNAGREQVAPTPFSANHNRLPGDGLPSTDEDPEGDPAPITTPHAR